MKKHSIFFAVAVTSAMFAFSETAESTTGYVPLANTVRKLKSDKALKVAVIGDSIAYGQMATEVSMQGYTYSTRVTTNSGGMPTGNPMSFARITTDYVKYLAKRDYGVDDVNIDTFYSVWGGATAKSSFGYVTDDIIARQPDLVFYEIWNDNDETLRYAENTLRVLWKTLPNTDVVLISVGGAFAKTSVYQPLVEKYGVKWIDAYGNAQSWFGQFGTFHDNTYGVVDANGKVSGTRGYLFGNSSPHVNEEGYVWFCDNIVENLDTFFASAADAPGASEAVAPAGSIGGDPIAATGPEMYHAEIVTPVSLTQASGSWTLIANEVSDEPRDTYDRANGDTIKAAEADATLTRSVTGKALLFRGSKNMQYKIGEGEYANVTDGLFVDLGDDDVTVTLTLKATAKDATINEFYVYGKTYQPITPKATKHRYSVKFYAKIAPEYYHDWHLGGEQVIPHPISWVNCYRMETYGAALTLPGENIISSQCEKNGAFLGWVEAEGVEWNGSEVIPTVTTHEGKTIYAAGGTIDPATLGRDVTLVAAYANGPVAKTEADVRKVTFVTENSANMRLLQFTPVYESAMSVTMPDLIPPVAGSTADGWKVINTDTVFPVGAAVPITTDTEFVPVYTKTVVINDELLADCWTFDGTYMTDGTGWKLKASVVGERLQITAVSAQPADTSVKLDLGRFAVNSAHDTIYYGYLIESNVFKSKTMTCAVDLGLVTKVGQGAFGATGITDVRFGPYLVEVASGWANGAFKDCASLTNVVFAQGASATVTSGEAFTFENCTALRSLDCSGIGYLKTRGSNYSQVGGCTALTNVVIRAPSKLDRDFFCGVSSVTYHFYGAAPELTSGALNLGSGSTTYVHLDTNAVDYAEQLASWNALTQGGTINDEDSMWKTSVVSGGRPLLLFAATSSEDPEPTHVHVWGEWYTNVVPTVEHVGELRRVCVAEGCTDPVAYETQELPKLESPEDPDQPDDPVVSNWVLNEAGTEITDGVWTFAAEKYQWGGYYVKRCIGYPDKVSELDFSKPFKDSSGNVIGIKGYDYCFATNKDTPLTPASERVGDLRLGSQELQNCVFTGCANLNLVGGFPQGLKSIGMHAFMNSGLSGDLDLTNIENVQRAAFKGTAITSVKFGAGLTSFVDAYETGVFQGCTSLTNVVFDSRSAVTVSGGEGYSFNGCTSLKEVDLSGVKVLRCNNGADKSLFKNCKAIEKMTMSNLTSITKMVFSGSKVSEYHFYGAAPTLTDNLLDLGASGAVTYIHLTDDSQLDGWMALAQDGVLNATDSVWKTDVTGTGYPLLLVSGELPDDPDDPPDDPVTGDVWVFSNGAITNGCWKFAAAVKSGTTITVGACLEYPTTPSPLDFSKEVKSSDGKTGYQIGELNTALATTEGWCGDGKVAATEAGRKVSALTLPNDGNLTTIGTGAFGCLENCTLATPLVPDSVTTMGRAAFHKLPVAADVRLASVVKVDTGLFLGSAIKSVWFGPTLKNLCGAWGAGCFYKCTSLTNVSFDAGISNAEFADYEGHFDSCTSLAGTIDLRGFTKLAVKAPFNGTKITEVLVGDGVTEIGSAFFNGMSKLNEVRFAGAVPTTLATPVFGTLAANQVITSVVETADAALRAGWAQKTEGGELTDASTWKTELVADGAVANRLLIIEVAPPPSRGLIMIVW